MSNNSGSNRTITKKLAKKKRQNTSTAKSAAPTETGTEPEYTFKHDICSVKDSSGSQRNCTIKSPISDDSDAKCRLCLNNNSDAANKRTYYQCINKDCDYKFCTECIDRDREKDNEDNQSDGESYTLSMSQQSQRSTSPAVQHSNSRKARRRQIQRNSSPHRKKHTSKVSRKKDRNNSNKADERGAVPMNPAMHSECHDTENDSDDSLPPMSNSSVSAATGDDSAGKQAEERNMSQVITALIEEVPSRLNTALSQIDINVLQQHAETRPLIFAQNSRMPDLEPLSPVDTSSQSKATGADDNESNLNMNKPLRRRKKKPVSLFRKRKTDIVDDNEKKKKEAQSTKKRNRKELERQTDEEKQTNASDDIGSEPPTKRRRTGNSDKEEMDADIESESDEKQPQKRCTEKEDEQKDAAMDSNETAEPEENVVTIENACKEQVDSNHNHNATASDNGRQIVRTERDVDEDLDRVMSFVHRLMEENKNFKQENKNLKQENKKLKQQVTEKDELIDKMSNFFSELRHEEELELDHERQDATAHDSDIEELIDVNDAADEKEPDHDVASSAISTKDKPELSGVESEVLEVLHTVQEQCVVKSSQRNSNNKKRKRQKADLSQFHIDLTLDTDDDEEEM